MTDFWKNKRVFITGATGMLGSWLTKELLDRGAFVVALVFDADPQSELIRSHMIQQITVVNGALENYSTLERAINAHEIDTVFHLGAQTIVGVAHRSPLATFEANIRGTYHLLDACRNHSDLVKRVVIASSDKAYGTHAKLPYTEATPLVGKHPYEVSKSCADLISGAYAHTYHLPVAIARCGNIYGGGDLNWSRVVPGTIRSLLFGEQPIIRSDGTYIRDYFYVKDAALAYLQLAQSLNSPRFRGEAFNFSSGKPLKVLEIVNTLRALMNCEKIEPQILNNAAGEIKDQHLSSDKARELLNWKPQYDLESGLLETIEWYRTALSQNIQPEMRCV